MKKYFNIVLIFSFLFLFGCNDANNQVAKKSLTNIVVKGVPKLVKKAGIPLTIASYSSDAYSKINELDTTNMTDSKVFLEVAGKMLDEEKVFFTDISEDASNIYNFVVKPATTIVVSKTKEFYDDTKPIIIEKYNQAEELTITKWNDTKPLVEEKYNQAKSFASDKWESSKPVIKEAVSTGINKIYNWIN